MTDPVTIGFSQNKWIKDSDTKALSMSTDPDQGTSSFRNMIDNSDYEVPTGKKFVILKIGITFGYNTARRFEIWISTSANSASGTQILYAKNEAQISEWETYVEISAGKFINYYNEASDWNTCIISGIETDA